MIESIRPLEELDNMSTKLDLEIENYENAYRTRNGSILNIHADRRYVALLQKRAIWIEQVEGEQKKATEYFYAKSLMDNLGRRAAILKVVEMGKSLDPGEQEFRETLLAVYNHLRKSTLA